MPLKVDTIQNPSSATVNLTLDTSGNATVGNNLTVTGTTTLTGAVSQTGSSTAASFIPSGSSIPTNDVLHFHFGPRGLLEFQSERRLTAFQRQS